MQLFTVSAVPLGGNGRTTYTDSEGPRIPFWPECLHGGVRQGGSCLPPGRPPGLHLNTAALHRPELLNAPLGKIGFVTEKNWSSQEVLSTVCTAPTPGLHVQSLPVTKVTPSLESSAQQSCR